jgi:TPP-dependent pyruvate/acetoin dehydrogenase alpha subunit
MRIPSNSGSRRAAPHSSHSIAKVDENGASHAGQRWSIFPPHVAHSGASSSSDSSNQRRAAPHWRQKALQCPSTLRRSSRSQSAAFPIMRDYRRRYDWAGVLPTFDLEDGAVAIARVAEPSGSIQEVKEQGLDREDLLQIYRNMLITRGVEERGHILYRQGKIPGSFYTGRGNEAASVGVAMAMGPDDVGTPLHRDMGVHITRGVEPWRIFAQYMGRADGPARGKDGNVHMADERLGLLAMVSHLPAMLPVAVGCALAFRIREERRVAIAWSGEGAMARGDAHEGMNFAGVRKLPVVFICDNNQWAYSTPTHLGYAVEHLADRAQAYGFDGVVVDGTDVLAVYRETKAAVEKAREGGGPTLIECQTLRMEGHAVHDDAFYVPKELFERWAERDPIERFRTWLRDGLEMTDDEENDITSYVKKLMNDSLQRAEESPQPDPATLLDGVYATADDLDTPHHK